MKFLRDSCFSSDTIKAARSMPEFMLCGSKFKLFTQFSILLKIDHSGLWFQKNFSYFQIATIKQKHKKHGKKQIFSPPKGIWLVGTKNKKKTKRSTEKFAKKEFDIKKSRKNFIFMKNATGKKLKVTSRAEVLNLVAWHWIWCI